MRLYLSEAVQIPGANYLGTGGNFDVFDIKTFAAAQEFKVENSNDSCGNAYLPGGESTFTANINESQKLYFFALRNTNKVYGAVVKSSNTRSTITIEGNSRDITIDIPVNFLFENAAHQSCKIYASASLPLYIIPDAKILSKKDFNSAIYVAEDPNKENKLSIRAVLPQFCARDQISIHDIPEEISSISEHAFDYGLPVPIFEINNSMLNGIINREITQNSFNPDIELISKDNNELLSVEDFFGANTTSELGAENKEVNSNLPSNIKEVDGILYELHKHSAEIIGANYTKVEAYSRITIPDEVENKPVTSVGEYAFYRVDTRIRLILPQSVKIIKQGAFALCNVNVFVTNPECVIYKYNDIGHITISK